MMPIKFRQVIRVDGKFLRWHYWGFFKDKSGCKFVGPIGSPAAGIKDSYQFTGKQDIEGKDVHAGDKVEFFGCNESRYTCNLPTLCKVVWFDESSGWMLDDLDGKHSYGLYKSSIVKVVGHIHEPEAAAASEKVNSQ